MRVAKFALVLAIGVFAAGQARAGIVLEFFQGTNQNDTTLSLVPFPNDPVTGQPTVQLCEGMTQAFVQVALHQTGSTTVINPDNGLAAYLIQGVYGPGQPGLWVVPGVTATSTIPVCNVADPSVYSLLRSFRTGPGGNMSGGNQNTATAVRFGGLNLNPPPSPSVDANGRIFLGTFKLQLSSLSAVGLSSITFQDPNPAPGTIDNITDMGDNLDALLFNGTTYTLPIRVGVLDCPEPSSFVLLGLIGAGAVGMRLRRRKAKNTGQPTATVNPDQ